MRKSCGMVSIPLWLTTVAITIYRARYCFCFCSFSAAFKHRFKMGVGQRAAGSPALRHLPVKASGHARAHFQTVGKAFCTPVFPFQKRLVLPCQSVSHLYSAPIAIPVGTMPISKQFDKFQRRYGGDDWAPRWAVSLQLLPPRIPNEAEIHAIFQYVIGTVRSSSRRAPRWLLPPSLPPPTAARRSASPAGGRWSMTTRNASNTKPKPPR